MCVMQQHHFECFVGQVKRPHDDSSDGGMAKKPRGGYDRIEIRLLIPYNVRNTVIMIQKKDIDLIFGWLIRK